MTKSTLTILFIFASSLFTCSFAQMVDWEISVSEPNNTYPFNCGNIIQTFDGGYSVIGTCSRGAYILKLDSLGYQEWNTLIPGVAGNSIFQTHDSGYAIAGNSNGLFMAKLDSLGKLLWDGGLGDNYSGGNSIIQTRDNGYAMLGLGKTYVSKPYYMALVKIDSSGKSQWTTYLGDNNMNEGYSLIQTRDGGYAVTGYDAAPYTYLYGFFVAKLDSLGKLQWSETIGGSLNNQGNSIIQTMDGGYAIAGITTSFGGGAYVVKLDSAGNKQWTKTLFKSGFGQSIIQTSDKGYVMAVQSDTSYIVKLDSSGKVQWGENIAGTTMRVSSIIQTRDGGFALCGTTDSTGTGYYSIFIAKLDSLGRYCNTKPNAARVNSNDSGQVIITGNVEYASGFGIDTIKTTSHWGIITNICGTTNSVNNLINKPGEIKLFPDPCKNTLTINFPSSNFSNRYSFQVIDITGRMLLNYSMRPLTDDYSIDVSSLSAGMYFIHIRSDNGEETKKFLKE